MKKIILTMMACAGLCACTNEEIVGTGGTTAADELGGPVAYITVNIKDVGSSTRAEDGGFAYGTSDEQKVANAYFYFYDADGKYLARGSVASVSGGTLDPETTPNIEWSSNTVVAVYGLEDVENLPTKMVTVLNQPDGFSGSHLSLSKMQAALAEATNGYADANGNFVMSTSSYDAGSTGTITGIVNYTALTAADFNLEPINLESVTPVDVYVERLAAKVGVTNSIDEGASDGLYNLTDVLKNEFADNSEPSYVGVKLLGWDINGTSRDSYMLKNISDDSNWSGLSFVWNGANYYRSYWAESPNYGITHTYPTSSNGNTDADENTSGLDQYLKYTSLKSPKAFTESGYCAENTNTIDVLGDNTSTGITNVLVKAQVVDDDGEGLNLVKYHGMYYTADGFLDKCVDDVVDYDFTTLVDDVITYLKNDERFESLSEYLDQLNNAIIHDHIYYSPDGTNAYPFEGNMLSLYNAYDGKVKIFFNMTTEPQWGPVNGVFTNIDHTLWEKYPKDNIVYGGADLDGYAFYFHVDASQIDFLGRLGLTTIGLLTSLNDTEGTTEYYLALNNEISFTTGQGHVYTLRNYLLRAITEEADAINTQFGSIYPIFYNQGLMYYSIPIEHLGTTTGDLVEGQYGVVRNHWYNITLTDISDLGHGIADENEVIVPQPELDYYYLGATVNILSWKMINQSASLK